MNDDQLNDICIFCKVINKNEALNMDDIDEITKTLKAFQQYRWFK